MRKYPIVKVTSTPVAVQPLPDALIAVYSETKRHTWAGSGSGEPGTLHPSLAPPVRSCHSYFTLTAPSGPPSSCACLWIISDLSKELGGARSVSASSQILCSKILLERAATLVAKSRIADLWENLEESSHWYNFNSKDNKVMIIAGGIGGMNGLGLRGTLFLIEGQTHIKGRLFLLHSFISLLKAMLKEASPILISFKCHIISSSSKPKLLPCTVVWSPYSYMVAKIGLRK